MDYVEQTGARERAAGLARDVAIWFQIQLTGVSAVSTDREAALETVRSRELTLQGPTPFVQGGYGVIVRRPIFIHGVNDTSGFGMPAPLNPYCGATCAYNPTNNTVFWGFAAVLIDLVALNSAPDSRLRMMDGLGYRYEVRALGLAAANMRQVAASSTLPGSDAMEAMVTLPNNEWVVRVAPAGGWRSNYYGGLIAAVVVLAFALSLILFAALVLWRRHQMLLASLLPRKDLHDAGGAALEGTRARVVLNTDTTADVMLRVLTDVVCGEAPAISDVMLVRSAIARSADIYQPIIGITEQMQGAHMDGTHHLVYGGGTRNGGARPVSGGGGAPASSSREAVTILLGGSRPPPRSNRSAQAITAADATLDNNATAAVGGEAAAASTASVPVPADTEHPPAVTSPFLTGPGGGVASRPHQHLLELPPRIMLDEVERVLAGADGWQFDTFRLAEVSGGLPLSALGYFLMQRAGLIKTLRLSAKTLIRCLRVVEAGYLDNPYHSATHAADVLQTLHVIIHSAELNVHYLDPLGLFAAYWAAIVHDYRHPGLTGDFLIATSHPLAIRYNDRSPLENHHAASSFAVLRRRGLELLQPLPAEGRVAFRKQVIEMVMATDMKQHFALCSQFSTVHRLSAFSAERAKAAAAPAGGAGKPPEDTAPASGPGSNTFRKLITRKLSTRGAELQEVVHSPSPPPAAAVERCGTGGSLLSFNSSVRHGEGRKVSAELLTPQPLDEGERLLALCVAIKAADLGHLGESLEVHKRWLAGLEEEFFRQGDQERELGMPISPLFDRAKQGVSKSQTGFYEFVGLPLVHALSSAFPGAAPLMSCFTANYQHWLRVQQEAQAQGQGH
ncbi:hypothetical protein HXX76_001154 [Chlamydomonas incerta]|uniref:Phosphodiesterase n=1 Tax=Chlamydomonas incerta TaxID=51695 RepID=A0A835WBK8_CHLIN|nr:hypothetical protein HXX76_001154 [Chlamydomonas incerta]|eukprot:KAG2444401.1 hypothetical protein HXX76_001154 [Chlamydomonas incerta]